MLTFAPCFWLAIWTTIGIAALVTAALCVALAFVPGPHWSRLPYSATRRRAGLHHGVRRAHA